jgi:GTP-binding protein LepA
MLSNIRNFSIIAHIDHGKTTLTDAFLRYTGTVSELQKQTRIMDSNPIEQEKGVTIKLAPVKMEYQDYALNLIDTPGHVDFGYEVSRSLAACEGALLLVDASQGIQAQTLANFQKAVDLNLKIIPVINKIDLPSADVEQTILECLEVFGVKEEEILLTSAKTGQGVKEVLDAIVERIPAPKTPQSFEKEEPDSQEQTKALVVTSIFDSHQGAIAYVRVVQGTLKKEPLYLFSTETTFTPVEIGIFSPLRKPKTELKAGEVGYLATGLKNVSLVKVGDTISLAKNRNQVTPLPGFKEPTPMVFMELYPTDSKDYPLLTDAMDKLAIHDAALQFGATHSVALGNGLRVGFLGIFHAEIIRERLAREYGLDLIATAPSVSYKVTTTNNQVLTINTPSDLPDPSLIQEIQEPITKATIFTPEKYLSGVIKLTREKRGKLVNTIGAGTRTRMEYSIPLSELITDFHDKLKSITSGYASIEYELAGYESVDAIKVNILINNETIEALSFITVRENAEPVGRKIVKKLKEVMPRQMFEIPIQAAIGGKIIARETIKAYRKDVTAKLYGGDVTRRQKLLRKQAKGKKKMKQIGKVTLNQEAFLAVLGD